MTESIPSSERGLCGSTSSGEDKRRTEATSALICFSRCFFSSAGLVGRERPVEEVFDFLVDLDFLVEEAVGAEEGEVVGFAFSVNHLVRWATVG